MCPKKEATRERYHVARLALFNTRLLNAMQISQSEEICKLIRSEVERNGFSSSPSLLNQGTFMSTAYICLVRLLESAKAAELEKELLEKLPETAQRFNLSLPSAENIRGPRPLKDWKEVLKLVRNALSHGNVEIEDEYFLLWDQNKYSKNPESEATSLKLAWQELGKLSEVCIHALTPVLWPSP